MSHSHQLDELKGKVWIFPTKKVLREADKAISGDENLIKKLESGCFYFATVIYNNKRLAIVFVHCPSADKKAVNELVRRMKSFSGKEVTAKEAQILIEHACSRISSVRSDGIPDIDIRRRRN